MWAPIEWEKRNSMHCATMFRKIKFDQFDAVVDHRERLQAAFVYPRGLAERLDRSMASELP